MMYSELKLQHEVILKKEFSIQLKCLEIELKRNPKESKSKELIKVKEADSLKEQIKQTIEWQI